MIKSSFKLREKAKKIMNEAKKIEEMELIKLGKVVLKLYYNKKIHDENIINEIKNIWGQT